MGGDSVISINTSGNVAGTGLSLSANTFAIDIPNLSNEGTADNNDLIIIYDDTASGLKKQTRSAFLTGTGVGNMNSFTISDGVTSETISDGNTITFSGTSNEVDVAVSATDTVTIGLPSSITANLVGDVTGNVSGTAGGLSATLVVGSGGTGQTSYTDGQLLIGNSTGNTLDKATLTQGSNVTITNGGGSITIAATDTNTEYTAGDGLDLTGTVFSTDLKTNGGLSIDTTELKLDLNDLSAASVNVANDSIAIIDADDNSSKKESIADLATAMADGSTITASNGVLTAAGGGGVSLGLVLALG